MDHYLAIGLILAACAIAFFSGRYYPKPTKGGANINPPPSYPKPKMPGTPSSKLRKIRFFKRDGYWTAIDDPRDLPARDGKAIDDVCAAVRWLSYQNIYRAQAVKSGAKEQELREITWGSK